MRRVISTSATFFMPQPMTPGDRPIIFVPLKAKQAK
jgi:hypothetical protein